MQSTVKKWFADKGYGFINNGAGPDVFVRKESLKNCKFLKAGVSVEFECHIASQGLIAKEVRLIRNSPVNNHANHKERLFGVMT